MNSVSNSTYTYGASISSYGSTSSQLRSSSVSGSNHSGKKKKKLNYSFKQISARVQNAKTASDAFLAYVSTLYKVVELKKKCTQDDYDASEASVALAHAEAILSVARKKKEHLKQEERAEHQTEGKEKEEGSGSELEEQTGFSEEELAEEMQAFTQDEIEALLKELEEDMSFEEEMSDMCELLDPSLSEDDIEEIKKKHRAREMMEITKADMKYLKAVFEKLEHDKNSGGSLSNTFDTALGDLTFSTISAGMASVEDASGICIDVSV